MKKRRVRLAIFLALLAAVATLKQQQWSREAALRKEMDVVLREQKLNLERLREEQRAKSEERARQLQELQAQHDLIQPRFRSLELEHRPILL